MDPEEYLSEEELRNSVKITSEERREMEQHLKETMRRIRITRLLREKGYDKEKDGEAFRTAYERQVKREEAEEEEKRGQIRKNVPTIRERIFGPNAGE